MGETMAPKNKWVSDRGCEAATPSRRFGRPTPSRRRGASLQTLRGCHAASPQRERNSASLLPARRATLPTRLRRAAMLAVFVATVSFLALGTTPVQANPLADFGNAVAGFLGIDNNARAGGAGDHVATDTVTPSGTTINLFDYWDSDQRTPERPRARLNPTLPPRSPQPDTTPRVFVESSVLPSETWQIADFRG